MLFGKKNGTEKRQDLREKLASGKLLRFPGSWSPLVSMLIEQKGFDGVYISGAVLSNDLGIPDIGMTTLTEVSQRGRQIARTTELPSIIDIDTGFGEPMSVVRTVQELEELGICGAHLEDQVNPKRCGHLDHKQLVDTETMCKKIKAAAKGRKDDNFVVIARTDSRASEGLEAAISRAKAYVDAGADMIFPEAMQDEKEFERFRKEIKVPLLANMTEFGKSKILDYETLSNLGYNIVIYPVTTLRLAMKAVEDGLDYIMKSGSQEGILDKMQHRKRLYEILHYEDYNQFDKDIFNFNLEG
ncbi:MAG: methylisocitrate lyase [Epsilonproteobacteria bacterium]|nr:MAG: methylisocitrate lyase [Campylobacterota bacterium]RLA68130.1 MAG: methylisocitrate lyase [Campylobacterota bacterium]